MLPIEVLSPIDIEANEITEDELNQILSYQYPNNDPVLVAEKYQLYVHNKEMANRDRFYHIYSLKYQLNWLSGIISAVKPNKVLEDVIVDYATRLWRSIPPEQNNEIFASEFIYFASRVQDYKFFIEIL